MQRALSIWKKEREVVVYVGETIVTLRQEASLQGSVGGWGVGGWCVTCSPPNL